MKFLRRILHIPKSTPTLIILRELGVIPIVNELESRQLNYLQHVLSLDDDDPVRKLYEQQKDTHLREHGTVKLANYAESMTLNSMKRE